MAFGTLALNTPNDAGDCIYSIVMAVDPQTKHAVRLFLQKLAGRFDVVDAILYGSRARGTHQPDSDADVAVLLRGRPGEFVATKLAMADVAYDVLLDTGIRIQPLPVWEDEWTCPETYSNPSLLLNIRREGVRI